MEALGHGSTRVAAGTLEEQDYEVLMATLKHGLSSCEAWRARSVDREASLYYQALRHKVDRAHKAGEVAESICRPSSERWQLRFEVLDNPITSYKVVESTIRDIKRKHQLRESSELVCRQKSTVLLFLRVFQKQTPAFCHLI